MKLSLAAEKKDETLCYLCEKLSSNILLRQLVEVTKLHILVLLMNNTMKNDKYNTIQQWYKNIELGLHNKTYLLRKC